MENKIISHSELKRLILDRLELHEEEFIGHNYTLLKVSNAYSGLWLEHLYDSIMYAKLYKNKLYLAKNALKVFIDNQKPDGQLPYVVKSTTDANERAVYSQIQECVSFGSLSLLVYSLDSDRSLLLSAYEATRRWVEWLKANRRTRGTNLLEMFVGFDTGHDNSPRVLDLGCPKRYLLNGVPQNAAVLPPEDGIAPVLAVDMSANLYGNLTSLAKMAELLGFSADEYLTEARAVKADIFKYLFDSEDCFFYDLDKIGNKRRILSSTVFQLFIEGVLDPESDRELISELLSRYILNKDHFFTAAPFPAVSISDPLSKKYTDFNCWGYYSQALLVLRSTLWMERYGLFAEHREVMKRFLDGWTRAFDKLKLGQELDPITAEPSSASEWYSSCMLTCLYAIKLLDGECS